MSNTKKRTLKVYKRFQNLSWQNKTVPEIVLKGEWLRANGFEIGDTISVKLENKKIIIHHLNEPKPQIK